MKSVRSVEKGQMEKESLPYAQMGIALSLFPVAAEVPCSVALLDFHADSGNNGAGLYG